MLMSHLSFLCLKNEGNYVMQNAQNVKLIIHSGRVVNFIASTLLLFILYFAKFQTAVTSFSRKLYVA